MSNPVSRPLPSNEGLTGQFYQHLSKGELRLQRCTECSTYRHIPRVLCPQCHGDQWEWALSSGEGQIYSWTTTVRPLHPAFAETPMTIATVQMKEGPRVLARLVGVLPEAVKIGMTVQAEFITVEQDIGFVQFRPS